MAGEALERKHRIQNRSCPLRLLCERTGCPRAQEFPEMGARNETPSPRTHTSQSSRANPVADRINRNTRQLSTFLNPEKFGHDVANGTRLSALAPANSTLRNPFRTKCPFPVSFARADETVLTFPP